MGFFSRVKDSFNQLPQGFEHLQDRSANWKSPSNSNDFETDAEDFQKKLIMDKVAVVLQDVGESLLNLRKNSEDWFGIVPATALPVVEAMEFAEKSRKALIQVGIWNAFAESTVQDICHAEKEYMENWTDWSIWIGDDLRKIWVSINSGATLPSRALKLLALRSNCIVAELQELHIRRDFEVGPLAYTNIEAMTENLIEAMGVYYFDAFQAKQ